MSKKKRKRNQQPAEKTPKAMLTPEEMAEYLSRFARMKAAQMDLLMIDEAFRMYMRSLGQKYNVGTRFAVNSETGELKEMKLVPVGDDGVIDG